MDSLQLELLHTEEELKSKLYVLQENVLKDLADAQGNILENQVKYESLLIIIQNKIRVINSV